jgi:hypothetical protein
MDFIMGFIADLKYIVFFIVAFLAAASFYVFKIKGKSFAYWKRNEGKGASASAALGISVIIGLAFLGYTIFYSPPVKAESDMFLNGTWFNNAAVYIGIDSTRKTSAQCVEGGTDDRLTSNMGFHGSIWRHRNKRHDVSGKLTHHSCVFGKDRNGYDGVGGTYTYWFYKK